MKIIVPISGGKDSQACLKIAVEKYGNKIVKGMFCDTKNEHPITYAHIEKMKKIYDVEIETVIDPNPKFRNRDVWERIRNRGKFPRDNARFCTQQLKIGVSARYYKQLLTLKNYKDGYHVWYGMRGTDESLNRTKKYEKYVSHELIKPNDMNTSFPKKLAKQGVYFVLPVVNWTTEDILVFLGDDINLLYKFGFKRVGCFPCFACATPKQLQNAYNFDDFGKEQKRKVVDMEKELGIVHQNSNTAQVCMWCEI